MRLEKEEYYQYMKVHPKLIYYAGVKTKLLPTGVSFENFTNYSTQEKYPIRNALYENTPLLEAYIKENAASLTEDDKAVIREFGLAMMLSVFFNPSNKDDLKSKQKN